MRRFTAAILAAGFAAVVLPQAAAAQCEGGPTVTGTYSRDGSYVPAHCQYTNPTTPGQLYPSGAQPMPSTNPAQGASRLPGQVTPAGLLPVNSSDLGAAPSYVNTPGLQGADAATVAPSVGPGAPLTKDANSIMPGTTGTTATNNVAPGTTVTTATNNVVPGTTGATADNSLLPGQAGVSTGAAATTLPGQAGVSMGTAAIGQPDQFPQTGVPALNGNRAVPSNLSSVNGTAIAPGLFNTTGGVSPVPGAVTGVAQGASGSNGAQVNSASGVSAPAAPARRETIYTSEQLNTTTVAFPGQ
jgi:hypothetical protein